MRTPIEKSSVIFLIEEIKFFEEKELFMKSTKKINLFPLFLLIFLLLSSCQKNAKENYQTNLSADELANTAEESLPDIFYLEADEDYLEEYLTIPPSVKDFTVRFAGDGNHLDEFGIWIVEDGTQKENADLIRHYFSDSLTRNRTFYDSYIPEETPKLRDAEVKIYGNTVVYAILSPADRKTFFSAIESALNETNR